jgi:hypothetical protein
MSRAEVVPEAVRSAVKALPLSGKAVWVHSSLMEIAFHAGPTP